METQGRGKIGKIGTVPILPLNKSHNIKIVTQKPSFPAENGNPEVKDDGVANWATKHRNHR